MLVLVLVAVVVGHYVLFQIVRYFAVESSVFVVEEPDVVVQRIEEELVVLA